jgi:hypothetical protein
MIRSLALRALPLVALASATPALAVAPTTCVGYATTIINGWTACAGFYDQNVLGGDAAKIALQQEAVSFLGGTYDGNFNALFGFPNLGDNSNGARTINFGQTFFGKTIIGAHFGNIGLPQDAYQNVSVFYLFDFGAAGANSITFVESRGLSNLYVFNGNGVPEPSTWAMLIVGFGAVGGALRAARRRRPALNYI